MKRSPEQDAGAAERIMSMRSKLEALAAATVTERRGAQPHAEAVAQLIREE